MSVKWEKICVHKGVVEMSNINSTISQNIKNIRERKKLTLDSAAQLTGVSRSMLAQIERGDANPTISILWKIANGYKVSFTTLVEQVSEFATIIRQDNVKGIEADEGRYINFPAFAFDEQRCFETYRICIAVGGHLQAKPHMLGTEEYITVFSGNVEITVQDDVFVLHAGDSVRFRAHVSHAYKNIGEENVQLSMLLYYAK